MTHTTNFQLSQWAKSDRIQMADFNADNQKIDEALAAFSTRNCRCYCAGYVGDGETSRSFTFPGKPMLLVLVSGGALSVANRGLDKGWTLYSTNTQKSFSVSWGEDSAILSQSTAYTFSNMLNTAYGLFAILEVA